jgi:glycerophosphoryl diester phosphodiesterase
MMRAVFAEPPVLCGHRGMGVGTVRGHVENTLGSFLAAVDAGLPWIEVDVRTTADGVLVACHDPGVDDGRLVAELAAEQTDQLGLLRLSDLLGALPAAVNVAVEVKTCLEDALRPRTRTTAALTAAMLAAEAERRGVLAASFDPAALTIAREGAAALPTGLLTWMGFPLRKAVPAAAHLGANVVLPHVSSFGVGAAAAKIERPVSRHVAVAHEAGLQVAAWCPAPDEAGALISAGVDCLIVDHAPPHSWTSPTAPPR